MPCETPRRDRRPRRPAVAERPPRAPTGSRSSRPAGRSVTWAELDDEVDRVAAGLGALGLVAGYRVVIALGNRIEFVTTYLGVLRARLVAVRSTRARATGELARMIADSGARLVVADAATVDHACAQRGRAGSRTRCVGADDELRRAAAVPRVVVGRTPRRRRASGRYDDLLADRGTRRPGRRATPSGSPCCSTPAARRAARAPRCSATARCSPTSSRSRAVEPPMMHGDDVVLGVLPLFHVYGLNAVLGQVLRQPAPAGARRRLRPGGLARRHRGRGGARVRARSRRRSSPTGAPSHDLARAARSGAAGALRLGAAVAASWSTAFTERTGIAGAPGLRPHRGRAGGHLARCAAQRPRPGSVGAALPGIELRLVDEAGRAPEGEDPGEIQIRGANLFSGYWPDGADGPDADGWWATGDVGFLDADGDLFLVDRLKELVIVSGLQRLPGRGRGRHRARSTGVAEAAVIGVADDAHRRGGGRLRAARRAPTPRRGRGRRCARTARAGWPGSSSRPRIEVVDELPHHGHRQGRRRAGCAASSAAGRLGLLE